MHASDLAEVAGQLVVIDRELAGLATKALAGAIAALDQRITTSREAVVGLDARIEDLIRLQTTLQAEQGRLRTELAALPVAQASAERLSDEIAGWKLLAKGLGNDGGIALSIDDAGPALTKIVNDLLLACYGPRFTIAIQTQTALANGEKREGFEIVVIDADSGSEKDFASTSSSRHDNAAHLAAGLAQIDEVSVQSHATNMVFAHFPPEQCATLEAWLKERGILTQMLYASRFIPHKDVSRADIDTCVAAVKAYFER